jgi:hypothetical protein
MDGTFVHISVCIAQGRGRVVVPLYAAVTCYVGRNVDHRYAGGQLPKLQRSLRFQFIIISSMEAEIVYRGHSRPLNNAELRAVKR